MEGFENISSAFIGLFEGENIGKQMMKITDAESISEEQIREV